MSYLWATLYQKTGIKYILYRALLLEKTLQNFFITEYITFTTCEDVPAQDHDLIIIQWFSVFSVYFL